MSHKKILTGILGGSFDPPHRGHIAVALAALHRTGLDEVWMMVSPENPLKHGRRMAPASDRMAMLRLALADTPGHEGVAASDFELSLPTPTFTANTLRALRERWPERDFRWIIGEDNLETLHLWREPEVVAGEFGLVVYPRNTAHNGALFEAVSKKWPRSVIMDTAPLVDCSSTEIREIISRGGEVEGMTTPSVVQYIKEKQLYDRT